MGKFKDTDYLYISTRLKVLEKNMLTPGDFSRIATAATEDDACKILSENGWEEVQAGSSKSLERAISLRRNEMLSLLYRYAPDPRVIDIFRLKYDYHNLKTYIKGSARNREYESLLTDNGTIPAAKLIAAIRDEKTEGIDEIMYDAAKHAEKLLAKTKDSQLSDVILDNAMARHMSKVAKATKSDFLVKYVMLQIDCMNIRAACRGYLARKDNAHMSQLFLPGGNVDAMPLAQENDPEAVVRVFSGIGELAPVIDIAAEAMRDSDKMEELDKACDNVLLEYLRQTRFVPFGEAQVITYLLLVENELMSVRIAFAGRKAGYTEEKILSKLRLGYYG